MAFTAETHQNEYLPAGATEVHAVVTVASDEHTATATHADRAIILIVDVSGSMAAPMNKMRAARQAAAAAIAEIPDGVMFALIAGSHEAETAYPYRSTELAVSSDATRQEAVAAAHALRPAGGTAIGSWLTLANDLFDGHAEAIKLAYLLTDGKNESETPADLQAALARCAGQFQCDARGVGAQWDVEELRGVAHALLGEVDIVREPDLMDDDFRAFLDRALGKAVRDVRLHLWTPQGSTIRYVKQVSPSIDDLTDEAVADGPLARSYPTGAWSGGESRDYHVAVDVPSGDVGQEKLAARVSLMVDGAKVTEGLIRAVWTEDHALTTRINAQVAHYTGQADLAQAIQEGLAARRAGDEANATLKLGRAVQLAHEAGNEGTIRMLAKVVDIDDAASGTIRVRRKVDELDAMELDTRSTRTIRVTARAGDE